jgi:hypothetical protein
VKVKETFRGGRGNVRSARYAVVEKEDPDLPRWKQIEKQQRQNAALRDAVGV